MAKGLKPSKISTDYMHRCEALAALSYFFNNALSIFLTLLHNMFKLIRLNELIYVESITYVEQEK